MAMSQYASMSARDIAKGIKEGKFSALEVAQDFIADVEDRDGDIKAFVNFDPGPVLEEARRIDAGPKDGPLTGVPMAVKDVFATAQFTTEFGSPIYRGHREAADAACVALAREAGAIVLGKSVTTEFATVHPGVTRNPHDLTRTPGGSSSGSVASVGAGMAMLGYGTQTAGSTIRPASYCGIVGFKPTYGVTPRAGLKLVSESLDTVGFVGRDVGDTVLFAECSSGRPFRENRPRGAAPKLAVCRTKEWAAAEDYTIAAVEETAGALRKAGAEVGAITLPGEFNPLADAQWDILAYEGRQALTYERNTFPDKCSETLHKIMTTGAGVTYERYAEALGIFADCQKRFDAIMAEEGLDAVIVPAGPGEAPVGLDNTGDPILNRCWTALYAPCMTLPLHKGPSGMPLGIQFVGRKGHDMGLVGVCDWVEGKWG